MREVDRSVTCTDPHGDGFYGYQNDIIYYSVFFGGEKRRCGRVARQCFSTSMLHSRPTIRGSVGLETLAVFQTPGIPFNIIASVLVRSCAVPE